MEPYRMEEFARLFRRASEDGEGDAEGTEAGRMAVGYGESLGALDQFAARARGEGRVEECARAHRLGLAWAAGQARAERSEASLRALLDRVVLSGSELLDLGFELEAGVLRVCAEEARAVGPGTESAATAMRRSPALSVLATLGRGIGRAEREDLLRDAWTWFERARSRVGVLAGYESEVECGIIDHAVAERCRTLAALEADLVPDLTIPPERRTSLEWRFVDRLRRAWGCASMPFGRMPPAAA